MSGPNPAEAAAKADPASQIHEAGRQMHESYASAKEPEATIVEVEPEAPVADEIPHAHVSDSMSFSEAFAAARAEVGPGGSFTWHGKVYGTYYKNEWDSMSSQEQRDFQTAAINGEHSTAPGHEASQANNYAYDKPIDINIQTTGGFSFNLGGVNYQAYNACKDQAYIASLNNQVNDLRAELATTAAALAVAESQLPCPQVTQPDCPEAPAAAPLMSTVRFTINSAVISNEEMVNVYNAAQYIKANPDMKVVIKGYADKDTGTAEYNKGLSERRAKAVYDALTKTYGISADRLSYEGLGSADQPYDTNNWNRIVIFVPGN